jgi:lambda family phage portal protein
MAQSWIRDGEAFAQQLIGSIKSLTHATDVPFSLELIEADRIPYTYTDPGKGVLQGIERDSWGKPVAYWAYLKNPDDMQYLSMPVITLPAALTHIPAARMLHVATIDRIDQARGVSEFASVITRLEDIKDYEESERVAAKIAAMLTGYVKRGTPELWEPSQLPLDENGNPPPRELSLQPGMIIDNLALGEEIGLIDTKRPNPNLITFRQGQLRAIAAGIGASYSSISRDYNGTYSAQRQELVEQWVHYAVLTDEFVGDFIQPVWEAFVAIAHKSGIVPTPRGVKPGTETDAAYIGQSMPWIDPVKEASAWLTLTQAGFASEIEVIRKRGANPQDVLEQITEFRRQAEERDLTFSSNAASVSPSKPQTEQAVSQESTQSEQENSQGEETSSS